jgi:hypothetical protein
MCMHHYPTLLTPVVVAVVKAARLRYNNAHIQHCLGTAAISGSISTVAKGQHTCQ